MSPGIQDSDPTPPRFVAGVLLAAALLSGCSTLVAGSKAPTTVFAPEPHVVADPAWPTVDWQLEIERPQTASVEDSLRIAVRPHPGELQVYKGASWVKSPGELLEETVLHGLEDSQKIRGVARAGTGLSADYTLLMDLRRFDADYAGESVPRATIEVTAKLLRSPDQAVVAARTFVQAVPAQDTGVAQVAQAFEQALSAIGHDIDGWVLTSGAANLHRSAH